MIKRKYLNLNKYSRPGKKLKAKKALVLHYFGWPKATKEDLFEYFNDPKKKRYASAHYGIDDGGYISLIPEDEVAYHVGADKYTEQAREIFGEEFTSNKIGGHTPNFCTIGFEIAHPDHGGKFSEKTYRHVVQLAAEVIIRNSIDLILRHYDISYVHNKNLKLYRQKACPYYYVVHGDAWEKLEQDIWNRVFELRKAEKKIKEF